MASSTDRDYADKGWLKEPLEETPFVVRVMDIGASILVAALILAAVVAILAISAPETKASSSVRDGAEWKAFLPLYFRNRDPVNPPRCPRDNARGEQLAYGGATQPDGMEWLIDCHYSRAAVRS